MQRFTNILFIYDPVTTSGSAFERALKLAQIDSAKMTVLSVTKETPRTLPEIQRDFIRIQELQINAFINRFQLTGVDIRTKVLTGTPFLEIIKEVRGSDHDLVIKSADGSSRITAMLFGSTDMHLFRKCPCPIWIIKPSRKKHLARIIAAVDPDPAEEANIELNARILDLAESIASREGSELHIVHAWEMPHEKMLRNGRGRYPVAEIDRMVRSLRKQHKQWLNDLIAKYDFKGLPVHVHLLKGEPGDTITSLAKRKKAELIVMGTVVRTGIPGFFIGNTAEKTLSSVNCSVLAVKPISFITPVDI